MELLVLHHVLTSAAVSGCGVLLVRVLTIMARFTLAVIALRKAGPEHVADVIRAAFPRWWRR